jgi:hypothetical protein
MTSLTSTAAATFIIESNYQSILFDCIAIAPSVINGLDAIAKMIRSLFLSRSPTARDDSRCCHD